MVALYIRSKKILIQFDSPPAALTAAEQHDRATVTRERSCMVVPAERKQANNNGAIIINQASKRRARTNPPSRNNVKQTVAVAATVRQHAVGNRLSLTDQHERPVNQSYERSTKAPRNDSKSSIPRLRLRPRLRHSLAQTAQFLTR